MQGVELQRKERWAPASPDLRDQCGQKAGWGVADKSLRAEAGPASPGGTSGQTSPGTPPDSSSHEKYLENFPPVIISEGPSQSTLGTHGACGTSQEGGGAGRKQKCLKSRVQ